MNNMKQFIFAAVLSLIAFSGMTSCKNCKKCSVNIMGAEVSSGKELCGDELKQAEAAGMSCQ